MQKTTSLLALTLLFAACGEFDQSADQSENSFESGINQSTAESTSMDDVLREEVRETDDQAIAYKDRKFIWNAKISYQVKSVDKSTDEVQTVCAQQGAFVSNMEFVSDKYRLSNHLEIRVENDKFHDLIKRFRKQATYVEHLDITSEDVTEEFVDIESRLNTKRDARDRYIEVLRNKAGTVAEILDAEDAIRIITEEIEVIEGRLRFLKDQVSYSTIHLTMYQKVSYKERPDLYEKSYGTELTDGLSQGWGAIKGIFLFFVTLWPLWIFLALAYFFGPTIWRKLKGLMKLS